MTYNKVLLVYLSKTIQMIRYRIKLTKNEVEDHITDSQRIIFHRRG